MWQLGEVLGKTLPPERWKYSTHIQAGDYKPYTLTWINEYMMFEIPIGSPNLQNEISWINEYMMFEIPIGSPNLQNEILSPKILNFIDKLIPF